MNLSSQFTVQAEAVCLSLESVHLLLELLHLSPFLLDYLQYISYPSMTIVKFSFIFLDILGAPTYVLKVALDS